MDTKELPQWKQSLPGFPHKLLNDLLGLLVEFHKEHLRRDIDAGRLAPADPWVMLRGFLLAAMQTYASICVLLADNRPKRLMLQAAILSRSLFEILTTVVAVTEDLTPRTRMLAREAFKGLALLHRHWQKHYRSDPKWSEYLELSRKHLGVLAQKIGLEHELAQNPDRIKDKWPTPGVMIYGRDKGKVPAFVSGSRQAVLKEIYESPLLYSIRAGSRPLGVHGDGNVG